jgi:HAD superfamily hydrolase (TIGR01549 family)
MAYEAVLFDIDGTLIDSVDLHARAWQETLAAFGVDASFDAVRAQIGKGGDQLLPVFVPPEVLGTRQAEIETFRRDLFKREYLPQVRAFGCVRSLFERIRDGGMRIGLASSANGDELKVYKRILQVEDLVDAQTSGDDVEKSKPAPDIFEVILAKLHIDSPTAAIVVGDSPYDAIAARRAGVRSLGVLCGGFSEDDLRKAGCAAIYKDPCDLLDRLAAAFER